MLILLPACSSTPQDQVCFGRNCFDVEIVQTDEERMRGLQYRESLGQDSGMLFIFKEDKQYSFWMKDTLIPLDIIWLDYTGRVVHIESDVPPCQSDPCPNYVPASPAFYVLEINAGEAAKQKIAVGDKAEFHL